MPKSKEAISDSDSSGSGSESEEEVKSKSKGKPKKPEKKKKQESSASSGSESESDSKSKKRQKKGSNGKGSNKKAKIDEAEPTWDIGFNKQVKVRSFKGKWFVDIREMYEKDGELLPGKKGVCLKPESWRELFKIAEEVNECVKAKC